MVLSTVMHLLGVVQLEIPAFRAKHVLKKMTHVFQLPNLYALEAL
jgi:hypothetical protein